MSLIPRVKKDDEDIQVGKSSPAWMLTYSDLMTQILIFFVMMFALAAAMNEMQLHRIKKKLEEYVHLQQLEKVVGLDINEKGLVVSLREKMMFDSGDAKIYPEAKDILSAISALVIDAPNEVAIEGHTDNVPISAKLRSKFPTNWELSTARATNVNRYLVKEMGTYMESKIGGAGFKNMEQLSNSNVADVAIKSGLSPDNVAYFVCVAKMIASTQDGNELASKFKSAGFLNIRDLSKGDIDATVRKIQENIGIDKWSGEFFVKTAKRIAGETELMARAPGIETIFDWTRYVEKEYETLSPEELKGRPISIIRDLSFPSDRISASGYGEYRPIIPEEREKRAEFFNYYDKGELEKAIDVANETETQKAFNRRVDFVIKRISTKIGGKRRTL